jgi:nicotinate-nucleotide adenylyltransferase
VPDLHSAVAARKDELMRIGVFGGTFDPVHLGHLILAELCREQGQLDQVWFMPAARPPHKHVQTSFAQRVEMLALALAGNPAFRIEEIEKDRPGPSFTVETLEELHRRSPGFEWHLLIGSDTLGDLPSWHQPLRLLTLASLLIVVRPGFPEVDIQRLRSDLGLRDDQPLPHRFVEAPLINISSRELRRRAAEGQTVRYQVPRAVECYLRDKQLYRM